jgi:hypothetical protein
MPTRFSVSAATALGLALAGCAAARQVPAAGSGYLKLDLAGRAATVSVTLPAAEVDPANDHSVTPLGMRGPFLLLTDSYASRGQAMSRCQAGHETWVRLIDTRTRTERWSKRVESCLHDIQPGEPPAMWQGEGADFTVRTLSEPGVQVSVAANGTITERK